MKTQKLTYLKAIVLGSILAGCSTQEAATSETSASIQRLPVDVKVAQAAPLEIEETVAGSVLASREVTITSELSKKVTKVLFKDGSLVSKGQLLYQLEDGDLIARLKQVEAELNLAQLNEQRLSQLLKSETVRQEEYDVAYSKLQTLLAGRDLLTIELNKTAIRAPFTGIAGITRAFEGSFVPAGSPLVTLQDQGTVKIQFTVSEKYINAIRHGGKITFSTIDARERYTAIVNGTEAGIDPTTRNMTVYATANNSKGDLKPGMSVRVYFSPVNKNSTGFMIPTQALIPSANGYSVFTVKNGAAKSTAVTIGDRTESEALIISGLVQGDTVMISNILRTGEGTPVEPITQN